MGRRWSRLGAASAVLLGALLLVPGARAEGCQDPSDPSCVPSCDPAAGPCEPPTPPPCTDTNTTCERNDPHAPPNSRLNAIAQGIQGSRNCKPVSISGGPPEVGTDPFLGVIRVNQCVFEAVAPGSYVHIPIPIRLPLS